MAHRVKRTFRNAVLIALALIFAAPYVYTGNPIVREIADYGSVGLNKISRCSPITAQRPDLKGLYC